MKIFKIRLLLVVIIIFMNNSVYSKKFFLGTNYSKYNIKLIKQNFKPGITKKIDKNLLKKLLIGEWKIPVHMYITFYKNGTFQVTSTFNRNRKEVINEGKWNIKNGNYISIKLISSNKWNKYKIVKIIFQEGKINKSFGFMFKDLSNNKFQDAIFLYSGFYIEFN